MGAHLMTTCTIKHRNRANGRTSTDVFIEYGGRSFYSRYSTFVADSAMNRALEISQFLDRLKRFPSILAP